MVRWILVLLLQVPLFWMIFRRMGLPPWLSILASLPVANLAVLLYVALTPWPVEAGKRPGTSP